MFRRSVSLLLSAASSTGLCMAADLIGSLEFQGLPSPRYVLTLGPDTALPLTSATPGLSLAKAARLNPPWSQVRIGGHPGDGGTFEVTNVDTLKGEQMRDYFPVKKGHVWYFVDQATGEEFNLNIQGNEAIHGVNCWKFQRTRAQGTPDHDLIAIDQSGVWLHYRLVRGNVMNLEPPAKFCDNEIVPGKVYVTEPRQLNPATGNTTIWTAKVEKFETITVPAGAFPCIRLNLSIKDSKLGTKFADVTLWYAKGLGRVAAQGNFFGVFLAEKLQRYVLAP